MASFIRFLNNFSKIPNTRSHIHIPRSVLCKFSHFISELSSDFPYPSSSPASRKFENNVAIFWDLDNKPPSSFPPYDVAIRLKKAASEFGFVQYMVAYANHHAFRYVPAVVREQRKERKLLNQLENRRVIKPDEPYLCRVCGRKFYTNDKLVNHFKQLHEREQMKRLNRLESAKGKRRVQLVGKFSMKMEKYKRAARDVLTPKVGYGLADEIKRAGFWVQTVSDKPQAADVALRNHMVEMMDKRQVDCFFLASNNSDFVDIIREARLRCLKTVVVGDNNDGALKRCADTGFSWKELMLGKAKKEAVSVLGRWKDRDILKKLEWSYQPQEDKKEYGSIDSDDEDIEAVFSDKSGNSVQKEEARPWWALESDSDNTPAESFK